MFFRFSVDGIYGERKAAALYGADGVLSVYSLGILCTALGFFCFSLLNKVLHGEKIRKIVFCLIGALAVMSAFFVLFSSLPLLFVISSLIALASLGYIGGYEYYSFATAFNYNRDKGRVIGIGMGCAVLLQFAVQNLTLSSVAFTVGVAFSVAMIVFICLRFPSKMQIENNSFIIARKTNAKTARTLIIAVMLMSAVCALLDGIVLPAHAAGQTSVSDFIRLIYAVSLIIAGFIADFKNGKYLSLLTVCTMFLSTLSAAVFTSGAALRIGTALIYLYSGFYVIFLTVRFLDFSQKTSNPALWAGMGRIIRGVTVAALTIPTALFCKANGNIYLIDASCVVSVVIMLILLKDISLVFLPKKEEVPKPIDNQAFQGEKSISVYASEHSLTPRETEVLEKLLTTEDGVQEIADKMYISRRVLQRYISSIYEKTHTKTRIGLFQSFDSFNKR